MSATGVGTCAEARPGQARQAAPAKVGLPMSTGQTHDDDVREEHLKRLAQMSQMDYEAQRKGAARALDLRLGLLDEEVKRRRPPTAAPDGQGEAVMFPAIELWPDPVDAALLLDDLVATILRYVVLDSAQACAVGLWIVHAHALEAASVSPLLVVTSPEKRCGKTTLLHLLHHLVPRPLSTASITPAALFRTVEKYQPTLLIDEADTFLPENNELRGTLNAGHLRNNCRIIRTVGEDCEPRAFRVWCPKAIALIGQAHPTLEDRALSISLRRRIRTEQVMRLRHNGTTVLRELGRRAARWSADHLVELDCARPVLPEALHDRAADNWEPLLAIADAAGNEWPQRARAAALALNTGEDSDSTGILLLGDIRTVFADKGADRLSSNMVTLALSQMEERPWADWVHGKPLTANRLARLLRPFGVGPKTIRLKDAVIKGYEQDQFTEVWDRYLASIAGIEPSQT